jgi:hypothetical protein
MLRMLFVSLRNAQQIDTESSAAVAACMKLKWQLVLLTKARMRDSSACYAVQTHSYVLVTS